MSKTKHQKHQPHHQVGKQHHPQHKERGTVLTILLILVMVHGALLAILSIMEKNAKGEVTHPVMVALFILAAIADVVAGIGMWKWKKWGYYLYFISMIVSMVVGMLNTGSFLMAFYALLPFAIVGWFIRPKWHYFE